MRLIIKTRSTAWEVLENEGMPSDASNAVVYLSQLINTGGLLKCRRAEGGTPQGDRWVIFSPAGLEYIAGEDA
jgi:hypothetical protein